MDPTQGQIYSFQPPVFDASPVAEQLQPAAAPEAPLSGEVLPPVADASALVPQYPIGLIDFNLPIVVLDNADYNEEEYDNASIVTVLKGSVHPVVISFWKHGEQCIAQFDTDGDSSCGDYKVEQEQTYPRTVFVVIGRDGRILNVDEELYASEDAARAETSVDDIAGIFPLVIQAPEATLADEVAGVTSHVADEAFVEGADTDDGIESEEDEDEVEGTEGAALAPAPAPTAPTEMYVAGRTRHVGETVHAYRNGFGTRVCTIVKLRRDARKSLFIDPKDGNEPYWALNKNVRY
ncbi:hypothetical protein SAMN05444163_8120 [Bradyrhizobium ottawaense]|uniref:Uncharacterized protein n=2 Tax=Bradyrhizobium ottawaense TaxID=931866 RepID=A0ABY0QHD5_9BRAD|nr:hypothetical protein SAMN05444163_8120 [Bradyrhizobium ottawaense]